MSTKSHRSKMYGEINKGTFDSKESLCLLISWNVIYLACDGSDVKTLDPDKQSRTHEIYEMLKNRRW